jgi:hypothetical protein
LPYPSPAKLAVAEPCRSARGWSLGMSARYSMAPDCVCLCLRPVVDCILP